MDLVLISHADLYHMGSLPLLFGTQSSSSFANTPIVCTLPVYKMGQMMLYDLYLNEVSPHYYLANLDTLHQQYWCVSYLICSPLAIVTSV